MISKMGCIASCLREKEAAIRPNDKSYSIMYDDEFPVYNDGARGPVVIVDE